MKKDRNKLFRKISKSKKIMAFGSLGAMVVGSMAPIINQAVRNKKAYKKIYVFNHTYFKTEEAAKKAQSRFLSLSSIFSKFSNTSIISANENDPDYRKARALLESFIAKMFAIRYFEMDKTNSKVDHFEYTGQNEKSKQEMLEKESTGKLKYGELNDITDLIHFAKSSKATPNIFTETDRILMTIFGDGSGQVFSRDEIQYINYLIQANHYKENAEVNNNFEVLLPATQESEIVGDFSGNTYTEELINDFNNYYSLLTKLEQLNMELDVFKQDEGIDQIEKYIQLEKKGALLGWNNDVKFSSNEILLRDILKKITKVKEQIANIEAGKTNSNDSSKVGKNHIGNGDKSNKVYADWELKLAQLIQRRNELTSKNVSPAPDDAVEGQNYLGTGDKTGMTYSKDLLDLRKRYNDKQKRVNEIIERIKLLKGLGNKPAIDVVTDDAGNTIAGGVNPNEPENGHKHQEQIGLGDGVDYTKEFELVKLYNELKQNIDDAKKALDEYIVILKATSTKLNPSNLLDVKEVSIYDVINGIINDDSIMGWNWKQNYSEDEVRLRDLNKTILDTKKELEELINDGVEVAPDSATEGTNESGKGLKDDSIWSAESIKLRDLIKKSVDIGNQISKIDSKYGNSLKRPPDDAVYSNDGKHYEPKGMADDEKYSLRFATAVKVYNSLKSTIDTNLKKRARLLEKYKDTDKFTSTTLTKGTTEWAQAYLDHLVMANAIPGLNSKKQYSRDEIAYRDLNKHIEDMKVEGQNLDKQISDLEQSGKATHAAEMTQLFEEYKKSKDKALKPLEGINGAGTGDKSGNDYDKNVAYLNDMFNKYEPLLHVYNKNLKREGYYKGSKKLTMSTIFNNLGAMPSERGAVSGYNNSKGGGDQNQSVFTLDKSDKTVEEYKKHIMKSLQGMDAQVAKDILTNLLKLMSESTEITWGKKGNEYGFFYTPNSDSLDQGDKSGRTYINLFTKNEIESDKTEDNTLLDLLKDVNFDLMYTDQRGTNKSRDAIINDIFKTSKDNAFNRLTLSYQNSVWYKYRDIINPSDISRNSSYPAYMKILGYEVYVNAYENLLMDPATNQKFKNKNDAEKYLKTLSYQEKIDIFQGLSPQLEQVYEDMKVEIQNTIQKKAELDQKAIDPKKQIEDYKNNYIIGNKILASLFEQWSLNDPNIKANTDEEQEKRANEYSKRIEEYINLDNFTMDYNGKAVSFEDVKNKIKEYDAWQQKMETLQKLYQSSNDTSNLLSKELADLTKADKSGEFMAWVQTHMADEFPIAGENTKGVGAADDKLHTIEQQKIKQLYLELLDLAKKIGLDSIQVVPNQTSDIAINFKTFDDLVTHILNYVKSETGENNSGGRGDGSGIDYVAEILKINPNADQNIISNIDKMYKNHYDSAMGIKFFKELVDYNNKLTTDLSDYISLEDVLDDYVKVSMATNGPKQFPNEYNKLLQLKMPPGVAQDESDKFKTVLNNGVSGPDYDSNTDSFLKAIMFLHKYPIMTQFNYDTSNARDNDRTRGDGSSLIYNKEIIDNYLSIIKPLQDLLLQNINYITVSSNGIRSFKDNIHDLIDADWPDDAEVKDDGSPLLNSKGRGDSTGNTYLASDSKVIFFDKYREYLVKKDKLDSTRLELKNKIDDLNNNKVDMNIDGYIYTELTDDKMQKIIEALKPEIIDNLNKFDKEIYNSTIKGKAMLRNMVIAKINRKAKEKAELIYTNQHIYTPIKLVKIMSEYKKLHTDHEVAKKAAKDFADKNVEFLKGTDPKKHGFHSRYKATKWALDFVKEEFQAKLRHAINKDFLASYGSEQGYTPEKVKAILDKFKSLLANSTKLLQIDSKSSPMTEDEMLEFTDLKHRLGGVTITDDFWTNDKYVYAKLDLLANIHHVKKWLEAKGAKLDGTPNKVDFSNNYKAIRAELKKIYKDENGNDYSDDDFPFENAITNFVKMFTQTANMSKVETENFEDNILDQSKVVSGYEMFKYKSLLTNVYNPTAIKGKKFSTDREDYENNGYTKQPELFKDLNNLDHTKWYGSGGTQTPKTILAGFDQVKIDYVYELLSERTSAKTENTNWIKGDGSDNVYQNWMFDKQSEPYKALQWMQSGFNAVLNRVDGRQEKWYSAWKNKFQSTGGDEIELLKQLKVFIPDGAIAGVNEKPTGDGTGNTYTKGDIDLYNMMVAKWENIAKIEQQIKDRVKFIDKGVSPAPNDAVESVTGEEIFGKGDQSGNTYTVEEYQDAQSFLKSEKAITKNESKIETNRTQYIKENAVKEATASTDETWDMVIDKKYRNVQTGWNNPLLYSEIERDYKGKSQQISIINEKVAESKNVGIAIAPEGAVAGKNLRPIGSADGKVWTKENIDKRDKIKNIQGTIDLIEQPINDLVAKGVAPAPNGVEAHSPSDNPDDMNALHPKDVGDATNNNYTKDVFDAWNTYKKYQADILVAETALKDFVKNNDDAYIAKSLDLVNNGAVAGVNTPTYWSDDEIELRDIMVEMDNLKIEIDAIEDSINFDQMKALTDESIEGENIAPIGSKNDITYSAEAIELRDLITRIIKLEADHGMTEFTNPIDNGYIDPNDPDSVVVDKTLQAVVRVNLIKNGPVDTFEEIILTMNPGTYYGSIDLEKAVVGANYTSFGDGSGSTYTKEEIDSRDNITKLKESLTNMTKEKNELVSKGTIAAPEGGEEFTIDVLNDVFAEYEKTIGNVGMDLFDVKNKLMAKIGKHFDKNGDASNLVYSFDTISNVNKYSRLIKSIADAKIAIENILNKYNLEKQNWIKNVMNPTNSEEASVVGENWLKSSFELRKKYAQIEKIGVGRTAIKKPTESKRARLGNNSIKNNNKLPQSNEYYILYGDITGNTTPSSDTTYIENHMLGSDDVRRAFVLKNNKNQISSSLDKGSAVFTSIDSLLSYLMANRDNEDIFPKELLNALDELGGNHIESEEYKIEEIEITTDQFDRMLDNETWGDE